MKLNTKKIAVLLNDKSLPLSELRLIQPLTEMKKRFDLNIKFFEIKNLTAKDLESTDVIILQRSSTIYILELVMRAKANGKKIVYEIDDLITQLPNYLNYSKNFLDVRNTIISILELSDAVSASTKQLANELSAYSNNIFITPNYYSAEVLTEQCTHFDVAPENVSLVVASSDKVLVDMIIQPVLQLQKELGVNVIAIGPIYEKLEAHGIQIERHKVMSYKGFLKYLSSLKNAVGIIPLDDSVFSSCKSPVKFFDYSKCGVPVICSNVIPYTEVIDTGKTGFLVDNNDEDWKETIRKLIHDSQLRNSLVVNAQKVLETHYGISQTIQSWRNLLVNLSEVDSDEPVNHQPFKLPTPKASRIYSLIAKRIFQASSYKILFSSLLRYGLYDTIKRIFRR